MKRRSKIVFQDPDFIFSSNWAFVDPFQAINLPRSFVGVSAMLRVEPFLKENVVMWSILLPLKTIDTHFSGLRVRSRSEHLSSIVNKRDW